MELTDEQKDAVRQWARKGLGLSDIQKQLESEYGLKMTYMDVRFLVIELDAELQDKQQRVEKIDATATPPQPPRAGDPLGGSASGVRVELDALQKPGLLVSGSVTFSDGTTASWGLDQMGRLALDAGDPSYKPSPEDVEAFQLELRNLLQQRGF